MIQNRFKKILVPFDGSTCAQKAFRTALTIGKNFDSVITVLICIKGADKFSLYYDSKFDENILRKQKTSATEQILGLEKHAKKSGFKFKTHFLETGSIVKSITEFSKSHKIDLIVMGPRGQTKFKKLLFGSVSLGVLQYAPCPVMIER